MFTSRKQSAAPLKKAVQSVPRNGGPFTVLNRKTGLTLDCEGGKSAEAPVARYMPLPGKSSTQEWYTQGRNENDVVLKNSSDPSGTEIFLAVVDGQLVVSPVSPTIEGRTPAFLVFKEITSRYQAILIDGKALTCPEDQGSKITLENYDKNNEYQHWSIFVNTAARY